MKIKHLVMCALVAFGFGASVHAETTPGPKGGRLLETKPLRAEFYINADRKAEVIFYDANLKPVAPAEQTLSVTAEPKSGRQTLEMEKTAGGFISKTALPAGDPYRLVVQVKESASAKAENFRFQMNLGKCGECSRAEYACICGH